MKRLIIICFLSVFSSAIAQEKTTATKALEGNDIKVSVKRLIDEGELKNNPLIVIDEKMIITGGMDSLKLKPERIASVSIVKKDLDKLVKIYGPQANNGVILIETKPEKKVTFKNKKDNILYLLNNKEISKEQLEQIEPNDIKEVKVIKDKKGIATYTNKKYDGIILITLKKS